MFLFRWCKRIVRKFYRKIRGRVWCRVHDNKEKFERSGYRLYYTKDKMIHAEGNGLNLSWKSPSDTGTADEVLCKQEYYFYADSPYVMFDIGFNIGLTSLYSAKNEQIKKIYSFEPFGPTRKQGEENLKNNPELAKKIELFDFGMGGENKEIEIHYNPNATMSNSTTKDVFGDKKNLKVEIVKVRKASEVLKPLFEKHSEKKFLKIDCEGAEREIIPDLDNSGLLQQADYVYLEWHFEDPKTTPKYLVDILAKNNFNFASNHIGKTQGFIIAFRK